MSGAGQKYYIGDGVYVAFDGYAIILTTDDGISVTNQIVLDPEVWSALRRCVEALRHSERADG